MYVDKLVFVGDGGSGKSCMLITYTTKKFPAEYVPTVFDQYNTQPIVVDGYAHELSLFDTGGQEDYDRLRPLSYPGTHVFVLCFDVANRTSFENIEPKWYPEISHHCPGVPILLVGCKQDLRVSSTLERSSFVTEKEAKELAGRLRMQYLETSSLTGHNLKEAFETAVRQLCYGSRTKKKSLACFLRQNSEEFPNLPILPAAAKAPWLEVAGSTFAEDWQKALEDPKHADFVFVVDNKTRIYAHKVMLICSCKYFRKMFGLSEEGKTNQLVRAEEESMTQDDINEGKVAGISQMYEENNQTVVEIASTISTKTFLYVLQFIYTGDPNFKDGITKEQLGEVREAAAIFQLPQLEMICKNIEDGEEFLNPSIGSFLNDEAGREMKNLFFNKETLSDIVFNVEGKRVLCHKAVVSSRCRVLAAMFSGQFSEGSAHSREVSLKDVGYDAFMALLEFIYTGHSPIEERDPAEILTLANQFNLLRLINLCEFYITKEVERCCRTKIEKSEVDVIGLLLMAQLHNAEQLAKWCLHFISSNYDAFQKRAEFAKLEGKNLEYVESQRWPPLTYLKDLEEYEHARSRAGSKCLIM